MSPESRHVAKSPAVSGVSRSPDARPAAWDVARTVAVIREVARAEERRPVLARPDVLLVRPWAPSAVPDDALVDDSLGVGYLAAALRAAGFSAAILDAFTFRFGDADVVACVAALEPRVLGLSLHSFADYEPCVAIADGVRALRPEIRCALGGEHATFLARELLARHRAFDAVVLAEGERALVDLVRGWLDDGSEAVPGAIMRRRDGSLVDGGARAAIADLDAVARPSKDVVECAILAGRPVAVSILTGRGCPHRCTFCTANSFLRLGGGKTWRRRSAAAVVDEIEDLVARFGGRPGVHPMLQFQDVVFLGASAAAREWTRSFADEMERRGLFVPFYAMARADAVIANEALLPRLVSVGLASIEIGIESGVDRILRAYDKGNSAATARAAVAVLQDLGIAHDASGFIMFDPRMTLDEVVTNVAFLAEIEHATWDRMITRLQVFPGAAIRSELAAEGLSDESGALDDVYGYRFRDPRVGELWEMVRRHGDAMRPLDDRIRSVRRSIAACRRSGEPVPASSRAFVSRAQRDLCDRFRAFVEVARGEAQRSLPRESEVWLSCGP